VGREPFCSRLLRGRAWSRMMHRRSSSPTTPLYAPRRLPNPRHSIRLRWPSFTICPFCIEMGMITGERFRHAKGPCCGKPEARAHRVVRAGEPSGSVKRRGRPTLRSDASCGTTPDRGEAASRRLHRPDHLAPHPTAFVRSLLEHFFREDPQRVDIARSGEQRPDVPLLGRFFPGLESIANSILRSDECDLIDQ